MIRDKTMHHENIIEAAMAEFLEYGFKDAFSIKENWFASSYIAIDEGPIVVMMENYRTGLLWDTFMKDEDVQAGLTKLGFTWK